MKNWRSFFYFKLYLHISIVLMDPASVGLMLYTEDLEDLFDIFQPLELDHAGIIFCPINDNKS